MKQTSDIIRNGIPPIPTGNAAENICHNDADKNLIRDQIFHRKVQMNYACLVESLKTVQEYGKG